MTPPQVTMPASARAITLFAVDLAGLRDAWSGEPVTRAVGRAPRGRLAALLGEARFAAPSLLDRAHPPQRAFAPYGPPTGRRAFDALLEDRAAAALYDAPAVVLPEIFAAIASIAKTPRLEAMHLDEASEPVYPPDLINDGGGGGGGGAGVSGPIAMAGAFGYVVWLAGSDADGARRALAQALSLPVGAFPTRDPSLFRDVADALLPLFEAAARPRHGLVASRS